MCRRDAGGPKGVESGERRAERGEAYLVPIGGGKDSVVTLELLRRAGKRIRPLIMNPRGATIECARVAGFTMNEVLVIRRTIDPKLLELLHPPTSPSSSPSPTPLPVHSVSSVNIQ